MINSAITLIDILIVTKSDLGIVQKELLYKYLKAFAFVIKSLSSSMTNLDMRFIPVRNEKVIWRIRYGRNRNLIV